jgi:bifunctional non-homologous end joining protein LigD
VIEAEFAGITHGGVLRQASFKGIREDKPAKEVVREVPAPRPAEAAPGEAGQAAQSTVRVASARAASNTANKKSARTPSGTSNKKSAAGAGGTAVRLTHPDRVYWPDVGVTKKDLAEYYVSVWDWIKPHILNRALSLVRAPEGVGGETFFQKHIAANVKTSRLRRAVPGKDHDVIAVETVDDLVEVVQSGGLEIHLRGSRLDSLETCDRIVFDLDPGEGVAWPQIVAAAREIRDRLAGEKLESFVKLSGGKGIHVVVPVDDVDWDTAKSFSGRIAARMAADSPKLYLAKMTKALRGGHIFIDRALLDTRAPRRAGVGAGQLGAALPHRRRQRLFRARSEKAPQGRRLGRDRQGAAEAAELGKTFALTGMFDRALDTHDLRIASFAERRGG